MRARHVATLRRGISRGRIHAALARILQRDQYVIRRGNTPELEWAATVHTIGRQLRGAHYFVTRGYDARGLARINIRRLT